MTQASKGNNDLRSKIRITVIADRANEFPQLAGSHSVFKSLGTPNAVLQELDRGAHRSRMFGAIVRALTEEAQARRSSMASNLAVYAFAPAIEYGAPVGPWKSFQRDFEQEASLALLEEMATINVADLGDEELTEVLSDSAHRYAVDLYTAERGEFLGRQRFERQMASVVPEDRANQRCKTNRVQFDPDIRHDVVHTLLTWVGTDFAEDPRMDAWIATTINGMPMRQYIRERHAAANGNQELERLATLTRKQKERLTRLLQDAVNSDLQRQLKRAKVRRLHPLVERLQHEVQRRRRCAAQRRKSKSYQAHKGKLMSQAET